MIMKKGISTNSIHGGEEEYNEIVKCTDIIPPIHRTAIYKQPSDIQIRGRELKYSREDNPTVFLLEKRMALLEGSKDSLAFSSGMAAISTLVLSLLSKGDTILTSKEVYGATLQLFRYLEKFGINVISVLNEKVIDNIKDGIKMVFVETITNPLLKISDIPSLVDICKEKDIILVIDNTFATPILVKPLELGVDYVIESATKYLGGHNDVIAGILAGDKEIDNIWEWRKVLGTYLDPFAAYLVLRGLKTLKLRVLESCRNAEKIVEFLLNHKKVKKVYYPTLNENYENVKKFMKGFGGVVSFEVESKEKALKLLNSLKIIKASPSLGGVESIISYPIISSHKNLTPEERLELGITDRLLRLSVGLEDIEDLIQDLDQALNGA
ncbi:MAG: aminotransferase class I/II-fold pyridoxal phosphate-dependent enzyme [Candidatus Methanomethylicia archaeon]|nr:aminotransferase class I/II-fold pyridoxal phosphate-dependent enzyme [Candidatus Methanomethylicia archaeon]